MWKYVASHSNFKHQQKYNIYDIYYTAPISCSNILEVNAANIPATTVPESKTPYKNIHNVKICG